ncbi:hypothetical protein PCANC_15346 [Puccinia coronata f. sp. avenae]|uniref:SigF-like NTF2-like domain-containing protein n=1 Tax=Puccinia coronata f. sp. avenae TaxID=200324 RepID=A0A2N5SXC0_9BASI|nr:hypothetical protein PCANC_15346 [Puccinia coronata f. sp. avenae]
MDDPVNEIKGVVRSLIEPYRHAVIAENVSKHFSSDAIISNPLWIRAKLSKSNIHVKSIYEVIRLFSINSRVQFQGVMFDETKKHCTIVSFQLQYAHVDSLRFDQRGRWQILDIQGDKQYPERHENDDHAAIPRFNFFGPYG